jgi:Tfp pilus assembly protein PilV
MITNKKIRAFSLVEVVLALGIFIFAGFSMIGLLAMGLQNSSDSRQQLQASTVAEMICSTLRAAPNAVYNGSTTQPNFPLPALTNAVSTGNTNNISPLNPIYLTWDGTTTTSASGNARFGLLYSITAPTTYVAVGTSGMAPSPGAATVYLYIYWPGQMAPTNATNTATSHFELTTTFALP